MDNSIILKHIDHYDILFKNSMDPILLIHGFEFVDCNEAALKALNMKNKEELFRVHPSQISPEFQPCGQNSKDKANEIIERCYVDGMCRFEWLHMTLDKKEFWVEVTLTPIKVDEEEVLYVSWRDIEKRKRYEEDIKKQNEQLIQNNHYITEINNILQNSDKTNENLFESLSLLEEYKKAIDESSIVSKTDLKGIITYVNDKFCQISGYSKEELLGKNHNIIRHPDAPKEIFRDLWETISKKQVFRAIICNKKKDGSSYYVDSTIIPILDKNFEIKEYIGIRHDISSVYEKDKIIYKQNMDDLTALPNRSKLLTDISKTLFPKLAIIDIDRFKDLNDSYGIKLGDEILKKFAKELLKFKSSNLNIYRISGDMFALLAYGNFSLKELNKTCEAIIRHLSRIDFIVDDDTFNITTTIGVATGGNNVIAHTEMALAHAKENNIPLCVFNDKKDIQEKLQTNIDFTKKIKHSLKNNGILMYGQKIFNNSKNTYKYETLMRMKLKDGTIISPFKFLEHAKKAKLYPLMTRIMIEKACNYFKDTKRQFSINLTIQDITNEQTVKFLINKLEETKTSNYVILEIVESEGIENFEEVSAFVHKMKRIGCKIAIDDFGTGYSNFEYIIKLNIDILKIDGSLIKDIANNENLLLTVSTIVSFAKKLNIQVVAEFVHSKEVYDIIKELGITHSQGYYLHEPEFLS